MHSQSDKLVMMANQIARAFAIEGETRAVPDIALHLKKFWNPRMRALIKEHVEKGGAGLDPLALKAVQQLN